MVTSSTLNLIHYFTYPGALLSRMSTENLNSPILDALWQFISY